MEPVITIASRVLDTCDARPRPIKRDSRRPGISPVVIKHQWLVRAWDCLFGSGHFRTGEMILPKSRAWERGDNENPENNPLDSARRFGRGARIWCGFAAARNQRSQGSFADRD